MPILWAVVYASPPPGLTLLELQTLDAKAER